MIGSDHATRMAALEASRDARRHLASVNRTLKPDGGFCGRSLHDADWADIAADTRAAAEAIERLAAIATEAKRNAYVGPRLADQQVVY